RSWPGKTRRSGTGSAFLPASGAYAPIMTIPYRRGMAMNPDRPWLAQYSPGVPAEINPDAYTSIVDVLDTAIASFRDRPAFRSFGKVLTYADIDRLSAQLAAYLVGELELKRGDRVAIMMPNCLQYPISTFGILRAGLT